MPFRSVLLFVVFAVSAHSSPITQMEGLRAELFAHLFNQESFKCALAITYNKDYVIPFKVVMASRSGGSVKRSAIRNAGAESLQFLARFWGNEDEPQPIARITKTVKFAKPVDDPFERRRIERLASEFQSREINTENLEDTLSVEAGIQIYVMPVSGKRTVREHLLLVETFPHEALAGALVDDLMRELRMNSRRDLLVISPDLDTKHSDKPQLFLPASFRDNGNLGTRAIGNALGMLTIEPRLGEDRQYSHLPCAVVRLGVGRPENAAPDRDRGLQIRDYLDADILHSGAIPLVIEKSNIDVLTLVQQWLLEGYYLTVTPPQLDGTGDLLKGDRRYSYYGQSGPSMTGER